VKVPISYQYSEELEREAMRIKFISRRPYAVQVFVGSINAISGESLAETHRRESQAETSAHTLAKQNYVVVPEQEWLDTIATTTGYVRQFVAMPVGSSYSVEIQATGKEEYAGMLFSVTPPESHPSLVPQPTSDFSTKNRDLNLRVISPINQVLFPFCILASADDTVYNLMYLIQEHTNIPVLRQRLIYNTKNLQGKTPQP
jgi:Ubiquitin family